MAKKMKLKYKVRPLKAGPNAGKFAIWASRKQYFTTDVFDNEADAIYSSLIREGLELQDKLDDVQKRLEATGRIDERDPHGWRC